MVVSGELLKWINSELDVPVYAGQRELSSSVRNLSYKPVSNALPLLHAVCSALSLPILVQS